MPKSMKLADLDITEASGVDHPAHLAEGWIVMKSEDLDEALELIDEGPLPDNPEEEIVDLHTDTEEGGVDEVIEVETPEMEPVLASVDTPDTAVQKELTDLRKQLDETTAAHTALKDEREMEKALESSHAWAILPELNPMEFAPVLRSLRTADPEAAEQIESILTATTVALKETGMLTELGTDTPASEDDPYAIIEARARDLVTAGTVDTLEKAITKVAQTEPALYQRYLDERSGA